MDPTLQPGIQVSLSGADKLRKSLVAEHLLEVRLQPKRTSDNTIVFPLSRLITTTELNIIKARTSLELNLIHEQFRKSSVHPKSLGEALTGIVPDALGADIPASMDIVGDLAVIELTDALAPYGTAIGTAIMQVNSNIKGVFSKAGAVSGEYRVRPLKWLVGKDTTLTEHKENGRRFLVDIGTVYFSPRLSTERLRVVKMIPPEAVVLDLFAGVGPYSILAASRGCNVIAVDINPQATALLERNAQINKVSERITVLTGDARGVPRSTWWGLSDHVIMNLPGHALEFLDLAVGAIRDEKSIIHFYCFAREPDPENAAKQLLEAKLQDLNANLQAIHEVRRVRMAAPREWQIGIELSVFK